MQVTKAVLCGVTALVFSCGLVGSAAAQGRDRYRDQPDPNLQQYERDGRPQGGDRKARPGDRRMREDGNRQRQAPPQARPNREQPQAQPSRGQRQVQPQARTSRDRPPRQRYDRTPEREWRGQKSSRPRTVYVPRRWTYRDRPHHPRLASRRFGRVWWCGTGCRIALLFSYSTWAPQTVFYHNSAYSFPVWEALEYNRTGETSLWESDWGYVEFTPTRTYTRRFGRSIRDCRDFVRIVVQNNGVERRYTGTACRNPDGAWWIES